MQLRLTQHGFRKGLTTIDVLENIVTNNYEGKIK